MEMKLAEIENLLKITPSYQTIKYLLSKILRFQCSLVLPRSAKFQEARSWQPFSPQSNIILAIPDPPFLWIRNCPSLLRRLGL